MGADVKDHFMKVQNAANSAAQIKDHLIARQSAIKHAHSIDLMNSRLGGNARTDGKILYL